MTDVVAARSLLTDIAAAGRRTIFRWAQKLEPRLRGEAAENPSASQSADETSRPDLPEDVAALFRWAHLEPIPYQDFSAARRRGRAEQRHGEAVARRDAEAQAKADAEQAGASAEAAAREANEAVRFHAGQACWAAERDLEHDLLAEESARERAQTRAEEMSREAAAKRAEAARRAQVLRSAERLVQDEAQEIADASAAAQCESASGHALAASSPEPPAAARLRSNEPRPPSQSDDPTQTEDMQPARYKQRRNPRTWLRIDEADLDTASDRVAEQTSSALSGNPLELFLERTATDTASAVEQYARAHNYAGPLANTDGQREQPLLRAADVLPISPRSGVANAEQHSEQNAGNDDAGGPALPSWIQPPAKDPGKRSERSPLRDTLQHSRERVASRWYALREIFHPSSRTDPQWEEEAADDLPPLLAIFSVAGGVGKTSLAACIARALAAQGERVLLVDTTAHGVLPFHFAARDLRPGVVRTFAPPAGSPDQPIHLVSYPATLTPEGDHPDPKLEPWLRRDSKGFSRVIVDVPSAGSALLQELVQLGAQVLVPMASTMHSVLSLPVVQRICTGLLDSTAKSTEPWFLLTHFDSLQPLQLDIREILQQQLGERLLPFLVRRSPMVAEALAEGMTVIDYAPGEAITKDYLQAAGWVRTLARPAREGLRPTRWSER